MNSRPDCRSLLLAGGASVVLALAPSCEVHRLLSDRAESQSNSTIVSSLQFGGTAIRSTAVATVRRPVTTARLGAGLVVRRAEELVRGNVPVPVSIPSRSPGPPGTSAFADTLTRLGLPAPRLGSVEFMVDGEEFFSGLEAEFRGASKFIDIQIYFWDNDDIGKRYADLLRSRAASLPVRVLVDDLATNIAHGIAPRTSPPPGFSPPPDMVAYLQKGSPLNARRSLNPWLMLDHTKLIVIDGDTAMLGGMNIGREYRSEWHDLMVRVRGPAVVPLHAEFERKWRAWGPWGDFALLRGRHRATREQTPPPVPPGAVPVRMLRTNLAEFRREIMVAMLEAIRASRQRVWIENPYLTNDRIIDELLVAKARGVDVRVIIPGRRTDTVMDVANLASARELIRAGAEVYRYPGMTHLKAMICDGWATVGSANLDTHSLSIIHELNIAFQDPRAVGTLARRVFLADFARSRRLNLADTDSSIAPLVEPLADQL